MVNRSYVQRIAENHLKNMADRAEMPEVCDELRFGYTESECREALMCFYDLLKEIYTAISEQPEKLKLPVIPEIPGNYSGAEYMKSYHAFFGVPHFLSCLGEAGVPGGDRGNGEFKRKRGAAKGGLLQNENKKCGFFVSFIRQFRFLLYRGRGVLR